MYENETWIYLDHWAVRHFATVESDRNRLLAPLGRHARLIFSGMNAVDLLGNEGDSIREMDHLFQRVGPSWHPIEVAPQQVINRAAAARIASREASVLDLSMAAPGGGFSLVDWVTAVRASARAETRDAARAMADRLNLWTLDPATPAWVHNMRRTNDTVQGVWGAVLEVVLRRREPFTVNHAIDSLHCVVPTAVCDFVLLDGHWTAIANQVATPPRRARAFSRRDGGIEAFLDALERITPPPEFK